MAEPSGFKFHCRYCKREIRSDGGYHYTTNALFPGVRAYWQDDNGIFYCLDSNNEYVIAHAPLMAEVSASMDSIVGEGTPEPVVWTDELSENDRRSFERWVACGSLKVSENPDDVDALHIMPAGDF